MSDFDHEKIIIKERLIHEPHLRNKPGELMAKALQEREARLRKGLAEIEIKKKAARHKATGKTKAQAYARIWLDKLTATELKHEVEIRDAHYGDFESMEQAIDYVLAAMFDGVVTGAVNFEVGDSLLSALPLSVHE